MAKIVTKKRPLAEWFSIFMFLYPFMLSTILQLLRLPSMMKYLMDAAWCMVLLLTLSKEKIRLSRKLMPFTCVIGIFLLYTVVVYLFNYQSGIYYLWGFRNNFRYYVAFLAFSMYLQENDAKKLVELTDKLFWLNAVVSLFQFFVMGYRQDYLGGLFGVERGCNGASLLFFILVISKSLLSYMNGQERIMSCFLKSGTAMIIAAMAEIKFFFLIYVIILLLASLLTRFSFRKFWMIFISIFLLSMGSTLLVSIFGAKVRLSFEFLLELITAKSYASRTDLGRFTVISVLSNRILTTWPMRLFGLGLGNCETSSFAICNTPFFQQYQSLHYTWFTSACLYLETGYLGMAIYLSFFMVSFIQAFRTVKAGTANQLFCQLAMIMAILCMILTFYNSSLRIEAGYIAYFVLALPYVRKNTTETIVIVQRR